MSEVPLEDARSSLTARTMGGVKWVYGGALASAALQLGYAAAMGRLLLPAAFGVVAMAGVGLRFGDYFARMGIGQALVQRESLKERHVRAGFTTSVCLGALFTGAFAIAAPLAMWLFDEPEVVPVLRLMSLSLILQGMATTSQSLLRRELRFKTLGVIEVTGSVVGYFGVGIPLAYGGAGAYSLVAASLSQTLLIALLQYVATRHPVRPVLSWEPYRELLGFGARVSIISFLEFATSFMDVFFVGRFAGAGALGQYNRAFVLVSIPLQQLTVGMTKVLFPSLSRVQANRDRLAGAYLTIVGAVAVLVLPVAVGMSVAAADIVSVLLGPQWGEAQQVLPVLAMAGAVGLITHVNGVMCEAAGVLNQKLLVQVASVFTFAALLIAATGGSLMGYALAMLAGEGLRHLYYWILVHRQFHISGRAVLSRYLAAGSAAVVAGASVAGIRVLLLPIVPALPLLLLAEVAAGAVGLGIAFRLPPVSIVREDMLLRLHYAGILHTDAQVVRLMLKVALGRNMVVN